jgi:hypothetical protein
VSLPEETTTVQRRYRPTIATQIAHYGAKLAYLAQLLVERDYSDAARELILDHAGTYNVIPDPYSACWRRPCDPSEAAAMLQKGRDEVRVRAVWRERNDSRTDWPLV